MRPRSATGSSGPTTARRASPTRTPASARWTTSMRPSSPTCRPSFTHYAPNNATLVVVGDFRTAELRRLVNQYFADIPSHAAPPPVSCASKLSPGTVRREVTDEHANLPAALRFYRLPPHDDPDTPALELLESILGEGESSRLNVGVVRHEQAALQAGLGALNERRGPGVLFAYGIANQGRDVQRLDSLIGAEVDHVS